ncbi:MAG: phospholipid carrier-dependent glycosyltransferase [Lewinellaceae bacterium]|nr:phospholipid carrier-dependent glycosyltransferase [Lewinellaceae bacterium]
MRNFIMTSRQSLLASFLILGLLAVLGTFFTLYATPQGLGLSDDSIAYIAGARSILSGNGYHAIWLASNKPVTHFPPGFSSILALLGLSGLDPLRGTRFINSLLFGANTFLLGFIGWRMTKSQVAGILLALLFLFNASMFRVHAVAMSEPLYIFFSLAAFITFAQYFGLPQLAEEPLKGKPFDARVWLILTGILTALAYLTRYAGLALLATFILALILLHDTWRKRLTSAGIFIAGFVPLVLAWSIRNKLAANNATNRTLVYHPLTEENINTGIFNFAEFLAPIEEWRRALIRIPNLVVIILFVIVIILLVWVAYKGLKKFFRPDTETPEILSFTSTLYIFGYLASIVSSMLLFDASTKFKLRINAPMYVSLLIMLVFFLHWLWQKRAVYWRSLSAMIAIFILAFSAYGMFDTVTQLRKGGQGYPSFVWFDSEAMAFLRDLPDGTGIYSNQPGPVYLYTDRAGYVLPDLVDPVTGLPREGYEEGIAALKQDVLSGNAVLVLFKFGSESENVQSIYIQLADGLYLAHDTRGDKIYTAFP